MSSGSARVIELERPANLTAELLDSMDWPANAPKAAFVFKEPASESSLFALSDLSAKYIARIGYTAQAAALAAMAPSPAAPDEMDWRTPTDLAALKALTRRTIVEHFYEPWRERESPAFLNDVDAFLEHGLSLEASAQYLIEGRAAGLINLMSHHDCHGRPVDHIAWVWIDASLTPPERAAAHSRLLRRLSLAKSGLIHAFVHSFNARSRRFFEKIGFTPSCLHISKRS